MPSFSNLSLQRLAMLAPPLQLLLREAIKEFDFKILDSVRDREGQELAFRQGNTKVHFGDSAHNYFPAVAVDIVPYPVDWNDIWRFRALQKGVILPLARKLDIPIRQGYDWDRDGDEKDERFRDWPHIELHPWREMVKKFNSKLYGE